MPDATGHVPPVINGRAMPSDVNPTSVAYLAVSVKFVAAVDAVTSFPQTASHMVGDKLFQDFRNQPPRYLLLHPLAYPFHRC